MGTVVLALGRAGRFSLGFLTSLLIAHGFGTSPETDAFFVARILPVVFMDWAGSILKVAFIPTHADVTRRLGADAGQRVAVQFALYVLVAFTAVAALSLVAAPTVIRLLAPGFDPEVTATGASMLRLMAPSIVASAIFLIIETLQNAAHHFSSSAGARVWGRASVVVSLFVLTGPLGANAMPVAFILGTVVQLVALGPKARAAWRGARPRFRPLHPGTREVVALLIPAAMWMLLDQLKFVVDQNFASRLASGKLAALGYAFGLVQVTVAVTGGAYLTALFPRLADEVAAEGSVVATVTRAMARVLLLAGYFVAVFMAASVPLVALILERGAFSAEATRDTAAALFWYAPAVLLVAVNMLLKVLLFLRRRTGPILVVGVGELALNVLLDALLVGPMGIGGLALATSLTTLLVMAVLPVHLARNDLLAIGPLLDLSWRVVPGSLLAGAILMVAGEVGGDEGGLRTGVALAVGALVAGGAYLGVARLTGLLGRAVGTMRWRTPEGGRP